MPPGAEMVVEIGAAIADPVPVAPNDPTARATTAAATTTRAVSPGDESTGRVDCPTRVPDRCVMYVTFPEADEWAAPAQSFHGSR